MKKLFSCMLAALVVACVCAFAGCSLKEAKEPHVLKESDKYIVITVSNDQMTLTENTTLADYMASLKEDGELTCEIKDGMTISFHDHVRQRDRERRGLFELLDALYERCRQCERSMGYRGL